MKIMREDVRQIAKLAALHLTETEIATTTEDLSHILELLNQLEAFPLKEDVEPLEQPFPVDSLSALRPDEALPIHYTKQALNLAPHTEDDVYLVPRVIE